MSIPVPSGYSRRVYPLDAQKLTEEQIAVAFAMTSRRPESFDEIAEQVSQDKAADFHERWVLGYGHSSVAEHAVLHLAIENISRIACDTLEDNRLASYTEKSSRYQVFPDGYYYVPPEIHKNVNLKKLYEQTCDLLFQEYQSFIDLCMSYLKTIYPKRENERDAAYELRLRRFATDSCRLLLPASSLTNVGITANARVLEHAISKLLSSDLEEERELGYEIRDQSQSITPTLIKYANEIPYLKETVNNQGHLIGQWDTHVAPDYPMNSAIVSLVESDDEAEEKLVAGLLYRQSGEDYSRVKTRVGLMTSEERLNIIDNCTRALGPHDAPIREFELIDYTFEFIMDYGAYREFKRHRMMSYLPQSLTVDHGYRIPQLFIDAGLGERFDELMKEVASSYADISEVSSRASQYLVTHAHYRRLVARCNLRECYHLFKLRTSDLAHFSIREPILAAMRLVVDKDPGFFRHLKLRDYPDCLAYKQE